MLTPEEIRNTNWEELAEAVTESQMKVHDALAEHGPATTRELAAAMGHTLEYVRPRVTELCQLGLAAPAGHKHRGRIREGIYRALSLPDWRAAHEAMQRGEEQTLFALAY